MTEVDPKVLYNRSLDQKWAPLPYIDYEVKKSAFDEFAKRHGQKFGTAYAFQDRKPVPLLYISGKDRDFQSYATPWEIHHSNLVFGDRTAAPVVDNNMTVIAHLDTFDARQIYISNTALKKNDPRNAATIIAPQMRPTGRWRDSPFGPIPETYITAPVSNPLTGEDGGLLQHILNTGGEVYADQWNSSYYTKQGYIPYASLWPESTVRAVVNPEGRMLFFTSVTTAAGGVKSSWVTPLDLISIVKLVSLIGKAAVRIAIRIALRKAMMSSVRTGVSELTSTTIRELTSGAAREEAEVVARDVASAEHLAFGSKPLPTPEKPDTVYRIMSNDEAAKTMANQKLAPPIRGAEGERFVSLDSNYTALFREKELADVERKFAGQLKKAEEAESSIRKRMAELKASGDADGAAKIQARLEKLEAEQKQRAIAKKAEADAVINRWHAMEGQQVLVEIQLKPGTVDEMLRRSVGQKNWGQYSRSGKDVFLWKLERGYGRNIGIPKWQIDGFNARIVKVRLHGFKQPLGNAGLPKPSGPN
jgi:hypothetical protein